MGGEALVVIGDLLAQVLLFDLQQGCGILPLRLAENEAAKSADEITDALEHNMGFD